MGVLMSPFGCYFPGHTWSFVSGIAALVVRLDSDGNLSHMRTIFRIMLHLEGDRWPELCRAVDASSMRVFVLAGSLEAYDPVIRAVATARMIHNGVRKSSLHIFPKASHMTWASGSAEQQTDMRRLVLDF